MIAAYPPNLKLPPASIVASYPDHTISFPLLRLLRTVCMQPVPANAEVIQSATKQCRLNEAQREGTLA